MAVETKKPEVPIAELLARGKAAAAAQAAKFTSPVAENMDPKPPAPVDPVGVSVENPVGTKGKGVHGRRRGRRGGKSQPSGGDVQPAAVVVAPVADTVQMPPSRGSVVELVPAPSEAEDGITYAGADERKKPNLFLPKRPGGLPERRRPRQGPLLPRRGDKHLPPAEKPAISPVEVTQTVKQEGVRGAIAKEPEPVSVISEQLTGAISGESKEEKIDQKVIRLKSEAENLRAGYVKADYDETNAWARVRKFFGKTLSGSDEREWQEKQYNKKGSYSDGVYWQAQYQNMLIDLKNAELERIRSHASEGKGWKKEMADMIKYFDLDEKIELIDARTEYRRGKQDWPTKIFDSIGAAGRWYNSIPLKNKMMVTAALAGVTIASVASGGLATGAMATALVGARRFFASAGLAVGTEALLDSSRKTYQTEETEKEIERLFGETPEKGFDFLEAEMQKKVFAMDDELQKAKLTKLLHKTGALSVGAFVGSGWLTEIAMNQWGGNEAADWIKERFGAIARGSDAAPVVENAVTPDAVQAAAEAKAGLIGGFTDQDIVVQKGDSVWKISGKLADQLGLEGSQKTHFIDALKDQYGDVFLREGETINFAQHGTDQDFVEKALQDAHTLTPAESIAIETNDAKIGAYAQANPEITLTNEVVNNILEAGESDFAATTPDAVSAGGAFGQETIVARGVSPEAMALYDTRAGDWYAQIFRMENASFGQDWLIDKDTIGRVKIMDILHDARLSQQGAFSGYTTGLDREQIANFAEFFQGVSKNDIGFDRTAFFKENPNATVMDYLKKVAPLVNQGQRFGLYTTTK